MRFKSVCNRLSSFVQMYFPFTLYPGLSMRPRETAPFTSAQDPGVLNKQSGQGIAKSARVPAWYCHKSNLKGFVS